MSADSENSKTEEEFEEKEELPYKKKKKMSDKVDEALLGYLSANAQQKQQDPEMKDVNHHFCMGVAEQLRGFTPALAAYARSRITNLLYELEYPQYASTNN